jgi:hypothetical protein
MWNDGVPEWRPDGVCRCRVGPCSGKGDGHGDGRCRKVTLLIFRSGKAMCTGAQSIVQVDAAYGFLKRVVLAHHKLFSVEGDGVPPPPSSSSTAKP